MQVNGDATQGDNTAAKTENEAGAEPEVKVEAAEGQEGAESGQEGSEGTEASAQQAEASSDSKEAEGAKPEKPKKNPITPFQARIDELTRDKHAEKRRADALEAELARIRAAQSGTGADATGQEKQGQAEDGKLVLDPQTAQEWVKQEAAKQKAADDFNNACNAAYDAGAKAFTDFDDAMKVAGSLGILDPSVVEDALSTDAPHEVLYALGKDPDEGMRLAKLPRNKRIAEFVKMTMKTPAKPQISKAAAPIKTVGGTPARDFDLTDEKVDMDEWVRQRNKQIEQARAAR